MTQVYLAAPTPMMRAGLRAMLEAGGLRVIGESSSIDGMSDVEDIDVLVVGDDQVLNTPASLPVREGETALLLLSETADAAPLLRSLPLRAWGIIPPDAPAADLQAAVSSVAQGLIVLSVPIAQRLFSSPSAVHALDRADPLDEPLTARETEVLDLLSQGLPNKLIARQLNISEHTVKFHVSSIYTKLGAASRTDAVNKGARLGLISF